MADTIKTPAYVTDENILDRDLKALRKIADEAACKLLYSPKACALSRVLEKVAGYVDGFGCSSLFELKLIDRVCGRKMPIHLVSPLLKEETLNEIGERLDYLTFNSLSQWELLRHQVPAATQAGIRVNPELSFVHDPRYDPCRQNSKLGVPISRLVEAAKAEPAFLRGITGLHFHNNCDETDFASLLATARHIQDMIPDLLESLDWINMGGGYLFDLADDTSDFFQAVEIFRDSFGLDVFIEPGAALVRRAGSIEATVHDLFESDGVQVAVLDTTVNHMAEVFEFQFEPDVLGHVDGGVNTYILAGCTCLAGDIFGEYSFDAPLSVGSRIKFFNMGAYTLSKAHRFNGVGLPTIYVRRADGTMELIKEDTFEEFARASGVATNATA
ncbi:MAG: hypothetical protein IIC06_03260 [Proteobacteria bacterium]|nr:hypothetical protein [Pseudomonadota bacterium]